MTSLTKTTSVNDEKQLIHYVGGPCYNGPLGRKLLFPFVFKNGTLEINPINGFSLTSPDIPLNVSSGSGGLVRLHGGLNLVQEIGPNFRTYILNCQWTDGTYNYAITNTTAISVYTAGVVTRVQQLDYVDNLPPTVNPVAGYVISTTAPTEGFTFNSLQNFGVTYAFSKPLVIAATAVPTPVPSGTALPAQTIYLTFFSSWDH